MAEDAKRQAEEVLALESIFPEEFRKVSVAAGATGAIQKYVLSLTMNLPTPLELRVENSKRCCTVSHLPPIVIRFILPKRYPSKDSPKFRVDAPFLAAKLPGLADELERIAKEGEGEEVLFEWADFIQNRAFDSLALTDGLVIGETMKKQDKARDSRLSQSRTQNPFEILRNCEEHDENRKLELFEEVYHHCNVCFESKSGCLCFRLRACDEGHVFCRECLKGFFESRIDEGLVGEKHVCCPGQCGKGAAPTEVQKLVSKDHYEKYDRLLLEAAFDADGDIIYCPRKNCGRVAIRDADEKRLAECYYCCYAFCTYCSRAYHPHSCIDLDEYQNATDAKRKEMEESMNEDLREKALTLDFLRESGGRQCPHCLSGITKTEGCNKMFCKNCGNSFCWLCGLAFAGDGYYAYGEHFSGRGYGGGCPLFDNEEENEFYQLLNEGDAEGENWR